LPEDAGYILRIDDVSEPHYSPFVFKDDDGNDKPPEIQTKVLFTVVRYEDPKFVGQYVYGFYPIKMHTKSNFYKLVKAAFGGDVDPRWKPNKADLEGKIVQAVISQKPPKADGTIYNKIDQVLVYRGTSKFLDVPRNTPRTETEPDGSRDVIENTDPVPF